MKHTIGELWKEKEGTKTFYRVQFPHGIMSFKTKKVAMLWVEQLQKQFN